MHFFGNEAVSGAQAEPVRIPNADGTLFPLNVGPDDALMPSHLTLSDLMGSRGYDPCDFTIFDDEPMHSAAFGRELGVKRRPCRRVSWILAAFHEAYLTPGVRAAFDAILGRVVDDFGPDQRTWAERAKYRLLIEGLGTAGNDNVAGIG